MESKKTVRKWMALFPPALEAAALANLNAHPPQNLEAETQNMRGALMCLDWGRPTGVGGCWSDWFDEAWKYDFDEYLFHSSWKHTFVYERFGRFFEIRGDTYREEFLSKLDAEHMEYFKNAHDLEVTELVWEGGIEGGRLVAKEGKDVV